MFEFKSGFRIYESETAIALFLSKLLNFTFTFVAPESRSYGRRLKDGNWTGLIGSLQRGETDVSFSSFLISTERMEAMDFCYPHYISRFTFATQKPQPLPKLFTIFYPFSNTLWISVIISLLVFSCIFSAMNAGRKQCVRTFFSTLASVCRQQFNIQPTSKKLAFTLVIWSIGVFFISECYKATLLSFLLSFPKKGISTISELASAAADGSVKCRTFKGSVMIDMLLESDNEIYRSIGKNVYKNSQDYVHAAKYLGNGTQTAYLAPENLLLHLKMEYTISEDSFFPMVFAFPVRKNFCCKEYLDKTLKRMVEVGILDKFRTDVYTSFYIRDGLKIHGPDNEYKLAFADIEGTILLLIAGYILASLCLVAEILFHKLTERYNNNNNSKMEI